MNGTGVSAVNAYTAHREWASRPADERYASVQALYDAARARRLRTEERTIETVALRTEAVASDGLLTLTDTKGRRTMVPAERITYVEIGGGVSGQVGFRS